MVSIVGQGYYLLLDRLDPRRESLEPVVDAFLESFLLSFEEKLLLLLPPLLVAFCRECILPNSRISLSNESRSKSTMGIDIDMEKSPGGMSSDISPEGISSDMSPEGISSDTSPEGISSDTSPEGTSSEGATFEFGDGLGSAVGVPTGSLSVGLLVGNIVGADVAREDGTCSVGTDEDPSVGINVV